MIRRWALLFPILLAGCADSTLLHEILPTPPPPVVAQTRAKHTEEFVVKEIVRSRADILWVIDNSGSMGSHQQDVIDNTSVFIQGFTQNASGADWKMGLISTDDEDAPYLGFVPGDEMNASTPNNIARFQAAVRRLGVNGNGEERLYDPLIDHLNRHPTFLRTGAMFFLIVVSDEEEQSRQFTTLQFIANVRSRVPGPDRWVTYGVLGDTAHTCGSLDYRGSRYEDFILQTLGKMFLICSDFGTSLAEIALDMGSRMEAPKLDLQNRPILSSLKVYYLDRVLPGGPKASGGLWTYDLRMNSVIFHDLIFAGGDLEKVRVEYETQE